MIGRVRSVTGHTDTPVTQGWSVAACAAGAIADPAALAGANLEWTEATAPGTAAGALRAAGRWSLDGPARRFDAEDWWWRTRVAGDLGGAEAGEEVVLALDGLATLADVWLDGKHVLSSDDMFLAHEVKVVLAAESELVIRCRSLDAALAQKRPRPRWKAPMIENQQMRWMRATLLGRTPGWSPPAAIVGPWRPVRLVRRRGIAVDEGSLRCRVDAAKGILELSARVRDLGRGLGDKAEIVLSRDGREHRAPLSIEGDRVHGRLVVPDVARWWPHTHGEPALYAAHVAIGGAVVDLGNVGFREVTVDTSGGGFAVHVNGARVFCRGACWTPIDPVTGSADDDAIARAVRQVTAAGMNMIRVGGTMVYESDALLDALDRAGVLLWQDLMFANMDYPEDDAAFVATATREVRRELARLEGRPSAAVICGNSEGEQQAAMFGAPRERWSPKLFHETFAEASREVLPDVPYWPSSAHGGAFPHQVDQGTTSYYGVGAYLRPLEDARRSGVRFASECLAFANVPSGPVAKVHTPAWKERVPRDLGAGWDFDDVRDHYVARLFGVDPAAVRYADHERYLALGRVATGEVMAQTFGEWRRARSACAGGLVWFLRDLWQGAGWGVVGADGAPKAAYHFLRRALAPVALHVSDEGNNGLYVHAVNDSATPIDGEIALDLFRGEVRVGQARGAATLPARGASEVPALALFDGFQDLNHAYRFGPPGCDLVVATLTVNGAPRAQAFHFPLGLPATRGNPGLTAELGRRGDGDLDLTLATRGLALAVSIALEGHEPDDDFFHLAPGGKATVRLRRISASARPRRIEIGALNADEVISVPFPS